MGPTAFACLLFNKFHPRVDKIGREQSLGSRNNVAKFSYIFPTRINCFFSGFWINFKINIVKLHITYTLQSKMESQSFAYINRQTPTKLIALANTNVPPSMRRHIPIPIWFLWADIASSILHFILPCAGGCYCT